MVHQESRSVGGRMLSKRTRNIVKMILILFLIIFLIIIITHIFSLYEYLLKVNKIFAVVTTTVVSLAIFGGIFYVVFSIFRYPKMIDPPAKTSDEYEEFLDAKLKKLKENEYLKSIDYQFIHGSKVEQMDDAYRELKIRGNEIMRKDANAVFLTTSVSQNGVLDGLSVLVSLLKTMYSLTVLYENRPNFGRLLHLYAQVAAVVLIARSIEDMDLIEEQLEPIMASLLGGSLLSAVPGAISVSTLVVNSVVEGSVNALLSLRVSCITQRYLSTTEQKSRKEIRRGASLEAAGNLGYVLKDNVVYIVKSFSKATKRATTDKVFSFFKGNREGVTHE